MAVSTVLHSDWVCPECGETVRSIVGSNDDSAAVRSRFVCPNAHEAAQQPIHRADWERERTAEAAVNQNPKYDALVCPACGEDITIAYSGAHCPNGHITGRNPIRRSDWETEIASSLHKASNFLSRGHIYLAIDAERGRQDAEWHAPADRALPLPTWLTVLTEEVGEVAHEILVGAATGDYTALRKELIQVAAVSAAMIEAIDAKAAPWGIAKGDAG